MVKVTVKGEVAWNSTGGKFFTFVFFGLFVLNCEFMASLISTLLTSNPTTLKYE